VLPKKAPWAPEKAIKIEKKPSQTFIFRKTLAIYLTVQSFFLNHLPEESVHLIFAVTKVTTLDKVVRFLTPSTSRGVQLEGPKEVGGKLEVGSDSQYFVNQILHADDVKFAQLNRNYETN